MGVKIQNVNIINVQIQRVVKVTSVRQQISLRLCLNQLHWGQENNVKSLLYIPLLFSPPSVQRTLIQQIWICKLKVRVLVHVSLVFPCEDLCCGDAQLFVSHCFTHTAAVLTAFIVPLQTEMTFFAFLPGTVSIWTWGFVSTDSFK